MRKIIIFVLLCVSFGLQAQRVMYDTICKVPSVTNDTTIFIPFRHVDGRYFEIDIDSLSANTDTIECGPALDKTFYANATGFPVLADKAAVAHECYMDGVKKSRIAVDAATWQGKYIAIRYVKVGSTTGCIVLIY